MTAAFIAGLAVAGALVLARAPLRPFVAVGPPPDRPGRPRSPQRRLAADEQWVAVADRWASGLAVGAAPITALARALDGAGPVQAAVAARIRSGLDPADALHRIGTQRGHAPAAALASCWTLVGSLGAGGAAVVGGVARALRDERALKAEIAAQVAAPRATARLVAVLPLVGPLLGALVGADTFAVLLGTPIGRALLVGGLALDLLGWWWVRRLIRRAERTA